METAKPVSVFKHVDNFVRGLANGLTLNFADKVAAAGNTIVDRAIGSQSETLDQTYARNEAGERAKTAQARSDGKAESIGEAVGPLVAGGVYAALRTAGPLVRNSGYGYQSLLAGLGRAVKTQGLNGIAEAASITATRMSALFWTSKNVTPAALAAATAAVTDHARQKANNEGPSATPKHTPKPAAP